MFVNTLPADARQILSQLGQEPLLKSFYLAGGSAAALHLGHRVSIDLDFFTLRDDYLVLPFVACLSLLRGRRGRRNTAHARSFRGGRC